jgi:hypothetical protein
MSRSGPGLPNEDRLPEIVRESTTPFTHVSGHMQKCCLGKNMAVSAGVQDSAITRA